MGIDSFLDKVTSRVTNPNFTSELQKGKLEFFERTGTPYEDLSSFESRLNSFLEWFILDRVSSVIGKKPIDFLIEDCDDEFSTEEKLNLKALEKNVHSVFISRKVKDSYVKVQDLFSGKKYEAIQEISKVATSSDEVFEARIFVVDEQPYFTNTYCVHPYEVLKFIKDAIRESGKKGENPLDLIHHLSKMSLMWETTRNIDIDKIYTL